MKWNELYDMAMGYVVPDRPLILSADDYSNVVHDEAYIGETGPARLSYGPTSIMFWHKPGVIYGHELLEALDDIVNNYHSGEKDVFVSWFMVRSRKGLFGVSKTKLMMRCPEVDVQVGEPGANRLFFSGRFYNDECIQSSL